MFKFKILLCSLVIFAAKAGIPDCDVLRQIEIDETRNLIELYSHKIADLEKKISDDSNPELNSTRAKNNLLLKESDFEYLLNLFEHEVINTPTNFGLQKLGDAAALFRPEYSPPRN